MLFEKKGLSSTRGKKVAKLRFLMIGDVVGAIGRIMYQKHIKALKEKFNVNGVIVNGENSVHGRGITSKAVKFFKHNEVDMITSGNHVWAQREIIPTLEEKKDLLRPANYPSGVPGTGIGFFDCEGYKVAVINLQGRVFMHDDVDCPFRSADSILTYVKSQTNIVLIDFHAEATSEKMGLAYYLDGRVSAVVGTHTHVQTADERVLPGGTAYISDIGMVGALNSMIGVKKEIVIQKFLTQIPVKFEVDDEPPIVLSGVCIEVDTKTGKATSIERVRIVDSDVVLDFHSC
ncbi:MAG: Metallophosphoesterase [candidate division TM6 bacterium GW2011_GWF2_32_72]|nr:MAG: Metallophosphoesterase [candidate division TM6 bacterium GW2011_GWF2_32_72]